MAENQTPEPTFIESNNFLPAGNKMATPTTPGQHISIGVPHRIYHRGAVLAIAKHIPPEPTFIERNNFPPAGDKIATPTTLDQHISPGVPQRIYRHGAILAITEHIPPEPFRPDCYEQSWYRMPADQEEVKASGQLGWCLKCPQIETRPKVGAQQHSLMILEVISGGYHRRSQVFKCQLDDNQERVYVAKAFDPAFSAEYPFDVTWSADASYSTEAAAYEDIRRFGYDGLFSPKYHGTWTFHLPIIKDRSPQAIPYTNTRPVRMVLMEYIEGLDFEEMFKVNVDLLLSPQVRLQVLNDIFKAKTFLQFAGVSHRDPFPRNVIMRGSSSTARNITANPTPGKVIFVDFEHAVLTRRPNSRLAAPREDRPINPVFHYWRHFPAEWSRLIPDPHFNNYAIWQRWMQHHWMNDPAYCKPLGMRIPPWARDTYTWFTQGV